MDFKLLGSILLIVGTCIGAGMLALPIATAQLGYAGSLVLLFVCWFMSTVCAFLLLEVNLWMPSNSNFNTMARSTIGPLGQCIAWLSFFFLLYSLVCAYAAGGSDLFHYVLQIMGMPLQHWHALFLFILIFGSVVWLGVRSIDYVNRGLILIKFTTFFLLIFLLIPHIASTKLAEGNLHQITSKTAIMVTITSFGFSPLIPSLRIYLGSEVRKLRMVIVIGSLIPLICYIAWDAVIMGVIPLDSLFGIMQSQNSTSDLTASLSREAASPSITFFVRIFTSVCVLTSFLGASLILTDFWADALQVEKKGKGNVMVCFAALLPPLIIVLFFPGIFVKALEYAGINCVILQMLLPVWMVWIGRYRRRMANGFTVPGGKPLLLLVAIFSLFLLVNPG